MEIKVESQKENKLLERKEILATILFNGPTPKREEVKNGLCSKLGLALDVVALKKIESRFGAKQLKVIAHVYKDAEKLKKTEARHILVRHGLAEKKAKKEKKKKASTEKAKK